MTGWRSTANAPEQGNPPGDARRDRAPAGQAVDSDLAALLDNEVSVIQTGSERASSEGRTRLVRRIRRSPEGIDVPPPKSEAKPVEPLPDGSTPIRPQPQQPVQLGPDQPVQTQQPVESQQPGRPQEPNPNLPLPVQHIGAIIVETSEGVTGGNGTTIAKATPPEGPGSKVDFVPIQYVQRTDEQKAAIISRISVDWLKALHGQIDDLYKQVVTEFSSPPEMSERALSMLREARQILVETPEDYVNAEYRTLQVRAMLDRTRSSRKQSLQYGPRVLGYQMFWMILFLLGLAMAGPLAGWITWLGNFSATASAANVLPFWSTMMWGGIGGVVGALYHLWWHVSQEQDFDPQYLMWYLVQPVMGLVLGGILFLVLASGMLILQVDLTNPNASTAARLLPYLLAVLGGFRQNFVYEQFDRLIALFTPGAARGASGNGNGKDHSA